MPARWRPGSAFLELLDLNAYIEALERIKCLTEIFGQIDDKPLLVQGHSWEDVQTNQAALHVKSLLKHKNADTTGITRNVGFRSFGSLTLRQLMAHLRHPRTTSFRLQPTDTSLCPCN